MLWVTLTLPQTGSDKLQLLLDSREARLLT
jgi:hypothetical protein